MSLMHFSYSSPQPRPSFVWVSAQSRACLWWDRATSFLGRLFPHRFPQESLSCKAEARCTSDLSLVLLLLEGKEAYAGVGCSCLSWQCTCPIAEACSFQPPVCLWTPFVPCYTQPFSCFSELESGFEGLALLNHIFVCLPCGCVPSVLKGMGGRKSPIAATSITCCSSPGLSFPSLGVWLAALVPAVSTTTLHFPSFYCSWSFPPAIFGERSQGERLSTLYRSSSLRARAILTPEEE